MTVAFFTNLGDLEKCFTDLQSCANRQSPQIDSFSGYVFRKNARFQFNRCVIVHLIKAAQIKQAYLPVPVASMGIAFDSQSNLQVNFLNLMFDRAFFFTDVDRDNLCHLPSDPAHITFFQRFLVKTMPLRFFINCFAYHPLKGIFTFRKGFAQRNLRIFPQAST